MSSRITNNMISRSVLADLNDVASRQAATRRQMSTGKVITRPSDDPYAAGRALSLHNELEGIRQQTRNVTEANGWMTITDTALGHIGDMAQLARELVVQGSTDTLSQTDRDALATQIDQLIGGMKQEANATYDGRYVLAGARTNVAPYDSKVLPVGSAPNDGFGGDGYKQMREIGPGVTLQVNVSGDEVLGGVPGDGKMIDVLRTVATHLRSSATAALGTSDLKALTGQIENLLGVRARVGAGMNRLETAESRLAETEESATTLLSNVEDADMAKTLIDYSTQQAVYQSALNAGSRIVQSSLLDFLR
jgi:flagellar hook-associated protein 3 FlgL